MTSQSNTVPMPGLWLLLGSQRGDQASNPYQIRPVMWDNPRAFLEETVQPYIDAGIDRVAMHRIFGEINRTDGIMDIATMSTMINGDDPDARDYATKALRDITNFFAENKSVKPTIYLGALNQPEMVKLYESGQVKEWTQLVLSSIKPFMDLGEELGVEFYFVFDYVTEFDNQSPEWLAYCMLDAMYPGRIEMEAHPAANNQDQWGTPCWISEDLYQERKDRFAEGQVGKITRVMQGPIMLRRYFGRSRGGLLGHIIDCHARKHDCYISDEMLERSSIGIADMHRAVQTTVDRAVDRPTEVVE